ncbi:hypothetical protein [Parenemella sanctibonifatiensis]|uniref:DUF4352 domain-containing protein n=1 Tax=Parenemella sanctibonifatiensis TaxID=2016505 RepID=A0A255EAT4_9ACTN|nr:hypothetical protein [Parenemella sanctibonifatiensis]OYN85253.1 hypothetical protein CGZ92_10620 [Parenemella sanctibonifatiensis]
MSQSHGQGPGQEPQQLPDFLPPQGSGPQPSFDAPRGPQFDHGPQFRSGGGSHQYGGQHQQGHQYQGYQPEQPAYGQPLTRQHDSVSVDEFAPQKSKWPAIITGIVIGAILLTVVLGMVFARGPEGPTEDPSPSETPATAEPTGYQPPPGDTVPFEDGEVAGQWTILETRWDSSASASSGNYGSVLVEVHLEQGELSYEFFAFDINVEDVPQETRAQYSPAIATNTMQPGDTVRGWVTFDMPRGNSTVYLTERYGGPISAIQIQG